MTSVFTARRRAEEFNSLVEQDSTGVAAPAVLTEFLALVEQLRAVPAPEPRPEFTAALRERLLDAADILLAPVDAETERLTLPPRRARDRRIAIAVGSAAIVGATSSLAIAAQSALPGDMLYPLKRAIESVELHTSDTARATSLLADAANRLDEATELSRTGDLSEGPHVEATLIDFADQADQASGLLLADYAESGDDRSVEALRDFAAASMDSLTQLESLLPEAARDELRHAALVLAEIDAAAEQACPACRGGIDQLPPFLLAAGRVAEQGLVVVPGNLLPDVAPSPGGRHDTGGAGGHSGPDSPLPGGDGVVPGSPDGDRGAGNGGAGTDNPLDDVTDAVEDGEPTSNGGLTGQLEDTVDDVVEGVDDALPDLPTLP